MKSVSSVSGTHPPIPSWNARAEKWSRSAPSAARAASTCCPVGNPSPLPMLRGSRRPSRLKVPPSSVQARVECAASSLIVRHDVVEACAGAHSSSARAQQRLGCWVVAACPAEYFAAPRQCARVALSTLSSPRVTRRREQNLDVYMYLRLHVLYRRLSTCTPVLSTLRGGGVHLPLSTSIRTALPLSFLLRLARSDWHLPQNR